MLCVKHQATHCLHKHQCLRCGPVVSLRIICEFCFAFFPRFTELTEPQKSPAPPCAHIYCISATSITFSFISLGKLHVIVPSESQIGTWMFLSPSLLSFSLSVWLRNILRGSLMFCADMRWF